jgi:hypothetical protein
MSAGIDWISDRDAYEALLAQAPYSTLLQCWAWGEAKAEIEGWRPRRAVITVEDEPVAVVQVLEKSIGPSRIGRLNRGPIWLNADLAVDARAKVMTALRRPWRWFRAGALLAAPELLAGDESTAMLRRLGFRPRSAPVWGSAWVELGGAELQLRKSLAGKWRNMLVNAEKAELSVEVMAGAAGIDWLMPRHQAMMAEKGFAGISPDLARALARHGQSDQMLTLVARAGGEDASAVLLARHGTAATYLVGWNGEAGRRLRGNHLLLWRAMLELKQRGCARLDLGGIDSTLTPGVAAFKRGLNGREYALAGEWLSL